MSYHLKVLNKNDFLFDDLERECQILKWLENKVPVPKVVYYEQDEMIQYLLMTTVKGMNMEEDYEKNQSIEQTIMLYANILKVIHQIDYHDCLIKVRDEDMLEDVHKRIQKGLVFDNFDEEYNYLTPLGLFQKLCDLQPKYHDFAFTHGDYCMDNLMVDNNECTGILDVGRGGMSDKYRDIALAIRSIKHDFHAQYIDLFLKTYGLSEPNWDKIEFYTIMDEFY